MADHWRLVLSNGVVVDVETRAHWFYSNLLYAACAWEGSTSGATPEVCVVDLASQVTRLCYGFRLNVHVTEIVAPGQLTRLEWKRRFAAECSEMIRKARVEERASCACQEASTI